MSEDRSPEGEAPIEVAGKRYTMSLTMRRAWELRREFGDNWGDAIRDALIAWPGSADRVALALEIATGRELTAEAFLDAWPAPSQKAIFEAWIVAHAVFWQGLPGMQLAEREIAEQERIEDEAAKLAAEDDERPLASTTSWSTFGPRLIKRVFARVSSGARLYTRSSSGSTAPISKRAEA